MKKTNLFLSVILIFTISINLNAQDDMKSLMQSAMSAMGMSGNSEAKDVYRFDAVVKMQMSTSADEKMSMKILMNQSNNDYAILMQDLNSDENLTSGFIYDMTNNIMLMLGDDGEQKTAVSMPIPEEMNMDMEEYDESEYQSENEDAIGLVYKKSGKTKNIAGYPCNQYIFEDNESKVELWLTSKIKFDMKSAFKNVNQVSAFMGGGMMPNGFLMELTAIDKETNETYTMKYLDFNEHANEKIDMADYMIVNGG